MLFFSYDVSKKLLKKLYNRKLNMYILKHNFSKRQHWENRQLVCEFFLLSLCSYGYSVYMLYWNVMMPKVRMLDKEVIIWVRTCKWSICHSYNGSSDSARSLLSLSLEKKCSHSMSKIIPVLLTTSRSLYIVLWIYQNQ